MTKAKCSKQSLWIALAVTLVVAHAQKVDVGSKERNGDFSVADARRVDVATVERVGDFSTLSVNTFRPLDAVATTLELKFGIVVSAEDPFFQFSGDLEDVSVRNPEMRSGALVPASWGFDVRFPVKPDGSPQDPLGMLRSM